MRPRAYCVTHLGLLLSWGLLAACATQAPSERILSEVDHAVPVAAWWQPNTLVLRFVPAQWGDDVYAGSVWESDDHNTGSYQHLFARLEYWDDDWPDELPLRRRFEAIPVLPAQRWNQLLRALVEGLVPNEPGLGVLLLVRQRKLVVFRDAEGILTYREAELATDIEIVSSYDQPAFLATAVGALESYLRLQGVGARRLLFQTDASDRASGDYVFVDLEQRQIVLLSPAIAGEVTDYLGYVGLSVGGLWSVFLRSHVLAFVKNPITSFGRLLNYAAVTTYNLVRPRVKGAASALPPVATQPSMDMDAWHAILGDLAHYPPYRGKVDFLIDGAAFFNDFIDTVAKARQHIDMRVYIFDRDDYAVTIADLLRETSRIAPVRILMDDMGTLSAGYFLPHTAMPPEFEAPASIRRYLREGEDVSVRLASNPWFTADHTKTIMVDGKIAYTGGMNIGREYRHEWHDMMVRLEGPIVALLQRDFDRAWAHAGPGGDIAYGWRSLTLPRPTDTQASDEMIWVQPLYTKTGRREIFNAHRKAIAMARNYIYIQNAYLSDNTILQALVTARARGVDVRVVFPAGNDSGIMAASNIVTANTLLNHGVRVYVYPGMTHIKAAIIDGWACLGSANFDKLSFFVNQEFNIGFSDPGAVARLRSMLFERDFDISSELDEPISAGFSDYVFEFVANQL